MTADDLSVTATTVDPGLAATLRRHLEGLQRTPDGKVLYSLIVRAMGRYDDGSGGIEKAFLTFLHTLLARCVGDEKYNPVTRVKARLIQQRLALYLLHRPEPSPAEPANGQPSAPMTTASEKPARPRPMGTLRTGASGAKTGPLAPRQTRAEPTPLPAKPAPRVKIPVSEPPPAPEALEAAAAGVETLAEQVTDSLIHNPDIESLLHGGLPDTGKLDSAISDFNDLKQLVVKGLDDLIRERNTLHQQLSKAAEFMKLVEADRVRLRDELGRARSHGLVDDVTGLPRQEIFTRALEAEVARVKRYGFSLAFAMIHVDDMAGVRQSHGKEAGDAVLRCYANEILSNFRSYDLVARYQDDRFSVLFPNTQKEGAQRALEKAQKRAGETFLSHDGRSFPLPRFSSVLTLYSPGEKAASLMKRAGDALDQARVQGPQRMVVSLPTGG